VLLDANVAAAREACVTISTEATQEAALEELLAKVTTKWAGIEFSVIPYKDSKDVYILGAIDEIQVRCSWLTLACAGLRRQLNDEPCMP
jgi:dynein heavy chain